MGGNQGDRPGIRQVPQAELEVPEAICFGERKQGLGFTTLIGIAKRYPRWRRVVDWLFRRKPGVGVLSKAVDLDDVPTGSHRFTPDVRWLREGLAKYGEAP